MFPVFVFPTYTLSVLAIFSAFMVFGSFRIVPMQTLATRVPQPHERARYMSTQTAVQHLSAALGSVVGAAMLTDGPGGVLVGMALIGWLSVGLAVLMPVLVWMVERRLRAAVPPLPSATTPSIHPV
jgi:predicted MFS family arabinose efflux permease